MEFAGLGLIGNAALAFEGELFSREPIDQIHGDIAGGWLREQIECPVQVMLALSEQIGLSLLAGILSLRRCAIPSVVSTARLK